ncbi:putative PEP-binding protein [Psychromicrobium xiongbiense]|uniref:putative PEP-binding protein n=1 Tax=Psychromicrobium xiongbiense TaxID=3051184 RepID=UPI002556D04C|nr:putative PEP-binding protein [Psychromicrobium sp. YIM S02556]
MTEETTLYQGVGVNPGRVVGTVLRMPPPIAEPPVGEPLPAGTSAEDAATALKAAAAEVQTSLRERAAWAAANGKADAQAVLEATALMATDPMLLKSAVKKLDAGLSAERALWEAAEGVATMLHNLGGYMAERTHDVYDVRARIVAALRGVTAPGIPDSPQPYVLVAEDLAPADTATLDPALVLALVTSGGGPQSHTAIIARSLGLPAVVAAAGVTDVENGTEVYVDGAAGLLRTQPNPGDHEAAALWHERAASLSQFEGPGVLADGTVLPLLANVGNAAQARDAAAAGAEGVGLFRTEFLFLERDSEPSVEEQVEAYYGVFAAFPGKKVVVRTLDAGADKPLPFLTNSEEPNPALGVRGYRTDLTSPGVLERQLSAITTAAGRAQADVWVMAPMISIASEAAMFAKLCREAGLRTPGVMIEVPAAALSARSMLHRVDFASLGTNDLTQYTMAADRQLGPLAELNDPWQPAVLALIAASTAGAAKASAELGSNRPVGVCGEAAANPALAVVLAGLGVNSLSMTARALPAVAAVLATVTLPRAQEIAALALAAESAAEAREVARAELPILDELGL